MAITGIDTIEGKQIIAAGAVSAKSAEMAYNDENGNPITGYLTAVPEGYVTTGDLNDLVTSISETYQPTAGMTAYQPAGDYYSASNPSGFITGVDLTPYQLTADMTAYQPAGDYLTTGDSANFYTTANESGFISEVPAGTMNESAFGYDSDNKISSYNGSAIGGSAPTYSYTDNSLISAIDASGLYASSGSANHLRATGTMGNNITQSYGANAFYYMPITSPFGKPTGIFSPLQYATGACLAMAGGSFAAYFKGNEWYVSNTAIGQALRGEVHQSRGVHLSGATTAGYSFDLNISGVSGMNDTANNYNWILQRGYVSGNGAYGTWKYGHDEDAALRAVSSCDMHESAFEYDASDNITGYNGSAFAGGSDVPEGVMVESGLEYNAVNEISGYNGSAIAQYGAEKQWLQHDDTLVHLSNSAQYALGVNLSAVAQLLGVDETVLWEDTTAGVYNGTITLNEPWSGFDKIGIEVTDAFGFGGKNEQFDTLNLAGNRVKNFGCSYSFILTGSPNKQYIRGCNLSFANNEFTSGTVISYESVFTPASTITCATGGSGPRLIRVVGIGRKA